MAERLSDKHVLGMVLFVISATVFFMVLILAFVFYRNSPANAGGPTAFNSLDVPTTGFYTGCLTASSATFWLACDARHVQPSHGASMTRGLLHHRHGTDSDM